MSPALICSASFVDRLTLTDKRVVDMAEGIRAIAALKDPVGEVIAAWERPNGLEDRARAHAARRHRGDLREPSERDGGCRCAVPEGRQCGHPALRLGLASFLAGDPCLPRRGLEGCRTSRACHPARAGDRSGRRRRDAARAWMAQSTLSFRAAARAWWRAFRTRRECPSSRTSKASAISMSTRPPISTWRRRSSSMPRCGAPASAVPSRPLLSIAL